MTICKGRLSISPGFCLLVAWFGAVNGPGLLATVLAAAVVHEGGHWLALRAVGAKGTALRVGVLGMVMETDSRRLSYGRELAVLLAGPGANLLSACLLSLLDHPEAAGAHLVLGAFNLLPIRPLDGGRSLHLLAEWLLGPDRGEWLARGVGTLAALSLAAGLCALCRWTGGSLWLLPAAGGFIAAAWRECFGK